MSTSPVIGITTYGPEQPRRGLERFSLPTCYVDAVERAGGSAVLLPAQNPVPYGLLARIDALMLSGGGDLDPSMHAGGEHETVYMTSLERDRFEIALVQAALELPDLPILGICRGMQVLNVALGGDLELHLPDVRGDRVTHRLPPREPTHHPVTLRPGTPLADAYGGTEFPVCSWHHQEVRKLGRDLEPTAFAEDGVVEGLIYTARDDVLAVQWHPEMQVADDPLQRHIFEWLVDRAGA